MENNVFEIIEKVNEDRLHILASKEYKLGCYIYRLLRGIKKRDICDIKKVFSDYWKSRKISQYNKENVIITNEEVEKAPLRKKHKIAVYTCVVGAYDEIHKPLVFFDNVAYFLFTDNPEKYEKYADVYDIRKVPEEVLKYGSVYANRYMKFHPAAFLDKFDVAVYIDGNVQIVSDIRPYVQLVEGKSGIAMHLHRARNCIYDEAKACKILKKGNIENIERQIERYRREGFPDQFGMNEATMIISNIRLEESKRLLDAWWNELIETESMRDQICWPYVLWKNNYTLKDVGVIGDNIYMNPKVYMYKHSDV